MANKRAIVTIYSEGRWTVDVSCSHIMVPVTLNNVSR